MAIGFGQAVGDLLEEFAVGDHATAEDRALLDPAFRAAEAAALDPVAAAFASAETYAGQYALGLGAGVAPAPAVGDQLRPALESGGAQAVTDLCDAVVRTLAVGYAAVVVEFASHDDPALAGPAYADPRASWRLAVRGFRTAGLDLVHVGDRLRARVDDYGERMLLVQLQQARLLDGPIPPELEAIARLYGRAGALLRFSQVSMTDAAEALIRAEPDRWPYEQYVR